MYGFNQQLMRAAERALADADVIAWLIDATEADHPDDALILDTIRKQTRRVPVLLVPNKVDRVAKPLLLPLIARWQSVHEFAEIVPISAATGDNVDRLEGLLARLLPVGQPLYPPEDLSDRSERFFIAETVRGQVFDLNASNPPYIAKRTGAIIVFERAIGLRNYIESGIPLDAAVTHDLIVSVFQTTSPMHDGAVILLENRVAAASCFLPLTVNPQLSRELGTRHRAAIGLTEETDAVAVIVSEESGKISLAVDGGIERGLSADRLRVRPKNLMKEGRADQRRRQRGQEQG